MSPSLDGDVGGGVRRIRRQGHGRIWRAPLPPGWLATVQTIGNGDHIVSIASDVACVDIAAVERHMGTYHGQDGIEACRLPICGAALTWRPCLGAGSDIASSA